MTTTKLSKTEITVTVSDFDKPDIIIENRIMGWVKKALELSGCKNVEVTRVKLTEGDTDTKLNLKWG